MNIGGGSIALTKPNSESDIRNYGASLGTDIQPAVQSALNQTGAAYIPDVLGSWELRSAVTIPSGGTITSDGKIVISGTNFPTTNPINMASNESTLMASKITVSENFATAGKPVVTMPDGSDQNAIISTKFILPFTSTNAPRAIFAGRSSTRVRSEKNYMYGGKGLLYGQNLRESVIHNNSNRSDFSATTSCRPVLLEGGRNNMITKNNFKGGIAGIQFLSNMAVLTADQSLVLNNSIEGNSLTDFIHESITFDCNGTSTAISMSNKTNPYFTQSSAALVGSNMTINSTTETGQATDWANDYYAVCLSATNADLIGTMAKVIASDDGTISIEASMGIHTKRMSVGDIWHIFVPFMHNQVINNTIKANLQEVLTGTYGAKTGVVNSKEAILAYGACWFNTFALNTVNAKAIGLSINSVVHNYNIATPAANIQCVSGFNKIRDNTIRRGIESATLALTGPSISVEKKDFSVGATAPAYSAPVGDKIINNEMGSGGQLNLLRARKTIVKGNDFHHIHTTSTAFRGGIACFNCDDIQLADERVGLTTMSAAMGSRYTELDPALPSTTTNI